MTRRSTILAIGLLAAALGLPAPARCDATPRLFVVATAATGIDASELAAVEGSWAFELGRTRRFDVITRSEVEALFAAEKRKDLAGCDSITCATELAAALDAPLLALPALARLENGVVLRLTILDARAQKVVARGQRECEDDAALWPTVIRQLVAQVVTPAPDPELAAPFDVERWRRRLRDLATGPTECRELEDCRVSGRERLAEIDRVLATTTFLPEDEALRAALDDRRVTLTRELDGLEMAILRRGSTVPAAQRPADAKNTTPDASSNPEAKAIVELAALEAKRSDTEWTWQNRDEKTRVDARIAALQAEIEGFAKARAAAALEKKAAAKATVPSHEEKAVEQELAGIERELASTPWRWENRDRKDQLEQRAGRLRRTLDQLRLARTAAPEPSTHR